MYAKGIDKCSYKVYAYGVYNLWYGEYGKYYLNMAMLPIIPDFVQHYLTINNKANILKTYYFGIIKELVVHSEYECNLGLERYSIPATNLSRDAAN